MLSPYLDSRSVAISLVIGLVAIAAIGPPVAAQSTAEPAFIVDVHADGSATVSVRSTFDLTTDAEQRAFETLMTDDQAQQDATARFLDRMQSVASDAENATGREMSITNAAIDLRRTSDNETGIATFSVTWAGLAAVEGETLIVTEPFASGFTPDRPFVLRAPDGYEITNASPEPDVVGEASATWNPGTALSGFAVELEASPTPTPTATSTPADGEPAQTDGQPGFGLLVTVLAVIAAIVAMTRYRTSK